ncbi:MAG: hypothetical protein KIT43_02740 [Bauldia sp.]|nr:hypothetical protein [Bauldia sp.]MCW5719236.1 hypothetical protein [Bauldia sp.]
MSHSPEAVLHGEVKRLKEVVERQFAELNALRQMMPGGDAPVVVDGAPYRTFRRSITPAANARTARRSDPVLWPTARKPANPLWPNVGFANYALDRSGAKVIGFAVFGMNDQDLEDAVKFVEDNQRRTRDFVPLFLTDATTIASFRKRGYSYEYFPSHRLTRSNAPVLREYAEARLDLVRRKWGLAGIVTLGESAIYPVGPVQDTVPAIARRRGG